ncbi:MAG: hypothetical protein C4567_03645 [Deltaproteobacteria bacterium]|nr:MAG: hypothetical protein C4567_03645 [Deltaproteobacteria bacterium]
MKFLGWRPDFVLGLVLLTLMGCSVPTPPRPLTATAARQTLEAWNPTFVKVLKFYGFHESGDGSGHTRVAYVLLENPSDQKQAIFAAQFQLLTQPDGRQQWYLTSLVTHATAGLSRRWGWDNLMVPVTETGATGSG